MSPPRIVLFIAVIFAVWTAMHGYVFWRLASVPWVAAHLSRRMLVWLAVGFWASYPVARLLNARGLATAGEPLEFIAANWVGVLFLLLSILVLADAITLGGWLLPRLVPVIRGWAAVTALVLAALALVQGLRPPVVRDYEVKLAGLPRERDGLVLVAVSDLHLGTLIGAHWMTRLIAQVNGLKPDIIVVVGDLVDSEVGRLEPLLPVLKTLQAPLGVWAVTGNHEYYTGLDRSVDLLQAAGYTVLRDHAAQVAPGLVLAGVDDLSARRQFGHPDRAIEKALARAASAGLARVGAAEPADRPSGAVILLSHSPLQAGTAAAGGAGLMLSGHTHNGQIWPFNHLVRLFYPLLGGRYEIDGMPVIVGRGTGTWGPRMRLWRPGEILRITLRAKS
ncbi:MAG: metallophosphoesterase [Opitutaceae bacterium]|nr:metallophosphoesterase [Opitutaceae bacterium]